LGKPLALPAVGSSAVLGRKIVITQCAPKNENTKTTAAQSHMKTVKPIARANEPERVRKISGDEQTIAVKNAAHKIPENRKLEDISKMTNGDNNRMSGLILGVTNF
jgi:hypothetical protein